MSEKFVDAEKEFDPAVVEWQVAELIRLRKAFRAADGRGATEGKDVQADVAIGVAENLMATLAGWALRHEAGKVLDGFYRCPPHEPDSDRFEKLGRSFWDYRDRNYRMEDMRLVLATILRRFTFMLPKTVGGDLAEAFEALNWGDVTSLVEPARARKGTPFDLAQSRLEAVKFVRYFEGQRMRVGESQALVADAYNVAPATVKSWEDRFLPEFLGSARLGYELHQAKLNGEYGLLMRTAPAKARAWAEERHFWPDPMFEFDDLEGRAARYIDLLKMKAARR